MTEARLILLMTHRISGDLSPEETLELDRWSEEHPANREFIIRLSNEEVLERELNFWKSLDPAKGYHRYQTRLQHRRTARIRRIAAWTAAACLLAAVGIKGLVEKTHPPIVQPGVVAANDSHPVMAGRNTATLTLANGKQILLDSAKNGELAREGNTHLVKTADGAIAYMPAEGGDKQTYNMLTTPRSGQYQLRLPDGSRVWLNNVSSLRYPASFQGKERTVELTGEAYFEIANDASKPFIVKTGDARVEVLGTSFNIMAYPEEEGSQTTVLTGAVEVRTEKTSTVLKPDQQADVISGGELQVAREIAGQDVVSWKNGFFYFGRASFAAVMRQLARWYDVDVVYEGKVPDTEFGGKIDRSLPLNDLLKYLDKNQIHFRLEGRRLIVLPN
jgi:transmembrane sensor